MARLGLTGILLTLAAAPLASVTAQNLHWTRQPGTAAGDYGTGVALDGAGNAYVIGGTFGDLGSPNAGADDVFLAKYNASGTLLWTRQSGTPDRDYGTGLAVDGAGNAYIIGDTFGDLGGPNA